MFIPAGLVVLGLAAAALLGAGAAWIAFYLHGLHQRLARIEDRSAAHRAAVNVSEVAILEHQKAATQMKVLEAQMLNGLMRLAFMRAGGDPDAPWTEVVKFWNSRKDAK